MISKLNQHSALAFFLLASVNLWAGTVQIVSTKSVFINTTSPDNNWNDNPHLNVTGDNDDMNPAQVSLVQFDLSTIPAGMTVIDAKMYLYTTWAGDPGVNEREVDIYDGMTLRIHRMTHDWLEDQCTWNSYDGAGGWSLSASGFISANPPFDNTAVSEMIHIADYLNDGTTPNTMYVPGAPPDGYDWYHNWVPCDITSLVQGWYDGSSTNDGLCLIATSKTKNGPGQWDWDYYGYAQFRFASDDNGDSNLHPYLEVRYLDGYVDVSPDSVSVTADLNTPDPADSVITLTNYHSTESVTVTITGQNSLDYLGVSPAVVNIAAGGTGSFTIDWYALGANAGSNTGNLTLTYAFSGTATQNSTTLSTELVVNDNIQNMIVVNPTSLEVTEQDPNGGTVEVTLGGEWKPSVYSQFIINITGYDTGFDPDLNVSPLSLVFDGTHSWDSPYTVTVRETTGDADKNDESGTLALNSSNNPGLTLAGNLPVTVIDDDALRLVANPSNITIDEDDTAGVAVQLSLSKTGASGNVTVTTTGFLYLDTAATYSSGTATQNLTVALNGTTLNTIYVYQVNDGNLVNESGLAVTVTDVNINVDNSPITISVDTVDDEAVNYVVTNPDDASWVPADGMQVSVDQTVTAEANVSLSTDPGGNETVDINVTGQLEISLDNSTWATTQTMYFSSANYNTDQIVYIRATTGASVGSGTVTLTGLPSTADLTINISIVTTYNVTGTITLTGSLQDITQVRAVLVDATTLEPVSGVQAANVDSSGNFTIQGVFPGDYRVTFESDNYDISVGGTAPGYTSSFTVTNSDYAAGTTAVGSTGKKHKGGGGGCALETTRNAAAAGAFLAALLLAVGLRRKK